jgi:hypothetical protein
MPRAGVKRLVQGRAVGAGRAPPSAGRLVERRHSARPATSSRSSDGFGAILWFARTLSGRQVVDLSTLIRRQSVPMITLVLHLLRLVPFLCGGHRQLALENLALRQQLTVYKRGATRPKLRRTDRLFPLKRFVKSTVCWS